MRKHQTAHAPAGPEAAGLQTSIQACLECYSACVKTEAHCLSKAAEYVKEERLRTLRDCASICRVTADFMLRDSPRHGLLRGVCAKIAGQCAVDCREFKDDGQMRACAELCDAAERSCRTPAP